jgi:hypothetical protein
MPKIIGKAGKSTRKLEFRRDLIRILTIFIGVGLILLLMRLPGKVTALTKGPAAIVLIGLIIVAIKLLEAFGNKTEKRQRQRRNQAGRGAKGEEKVGAILESLPEDYVVLHDVACRYGNIDHVVVGPNGVFALETKSHGGRVRMEDGKLLVNGKPPEKDFIKQALRNGLWLRDLLKEKLGLEIFVQAMVVFSRAFVESVPRTKGVTVTHAGNLSRLITRSKSKDIPVDRVAAALASTGEVVPHTELEKPSNPTNDRG